MNPPDLGADPLVWPALLALGALSAFLRISGFWLMRFVPLTPRVRRMLEAMPGSILIAAIVPGVLRGGIVPVVAVLAALLTMRGTKNDFLAVAAAMAVAAGGRAIGL